MSRRNLLVGKVVALRVVVDLGDRCCWTAMKTVLRMEMTEY